MPPGGSRVLAAVLRPPHPALPPAALAAVALLDVAASLRDWSIPITGLLDEPAHLLTAWLFLAALGFRWGTRLQAWTLLGAVGIDLDHVPLYLWWEGISAPGGRPVTHSLATVLVLVAMAAVPRLRTPALGLALGVVLHLARDLATGPGVPLLWPLSTTSALLPYPVYAAALGITAALAVLAAFRRRRSRVSG